MKSYGRIISTSRILSPVNIALYTLTIYTTSLFLTNFFSITDYSGRTIGLGGHSWPNIADYKLYADSGLFYLNPGSYGSFEPFKTQLAGPIFPLILKSVGFNVTYLAITLATMASLANLILSRLSNILLPIRYNIAFKLYPTDISQVISFAEKKKIMPQKSTWFHPKPLDGLISCKIIS